MFKRLANLVSRQENVQTSAPKSNSFSNHEDAVAVLLDRCETLEDQLRAAEHKSAKYEIELRRLSDLDDRNAYLENELDMLFFGLVEDLESEPMKIAKERSDYLLKVLCKNEEYVARITEEFNRMFTYMIGDMGNLFIDLTETLGKNHQYELDLEKLEETNKNLRNEINHLTIKLDGADIKIGSYESQLVELDMLKLELAEAVEAKMNFDSLLSRELLKSIALESKLVEQDMMTSELTSALEDNMKLRGQLNVKCHFRSNFPTDDVVDTTDSESSDDDIRVRAPSE